MSWYKFLLVQELLPELVPVGLSSKALYRFKIQLRNIGCGDDVCEGEELTQTLPIIEWEHGSSADSRVASSICDYFYAYNRTALRYKTSGVIGSGSHDTHFLHSTQRVFPICFLLLLYLHVLSVVFVPLSLSRSLAPSFPLSLSLSRMHVRPHWQATSVFVFPCYSYAPAAPHHPPLSSSRKPSAAAAWRLATTDRGGFVSGHTFGPPQEPTAPLITRSRLPPQPRTHS